MYLYLANSPPTHDRKSHDLEGKFQETQLDVSINTCQICMEFEAYRGSYMSAHVLLNLLNELGKAIK